MQTHTITVPASIDDAVLFGLEVDVKLDYTPYDPGSRFEEPTCEEIEILSITAGGQEVPIIDYVHEYYYDVLLKQAREEYLEGRF